MEDGSRIVASPLAGELGPGMLRLPLERIAQAHERVDAGTGDRTLVSISA